MIRRVALFAQAFAFITALLCLGGAAFAQEEVVLTVDGAIGKGQSVTFTMAQLDAMPQTDIKTKTPWHDGAHTFSGPKLRLVLDTVSATGTTITAHALNDYAADLPAEDADKYGVILATRMDGELLPVRDKGPIFVIYPYDSDPVLQHDVYYTRSVWQVDKLTLK